MTLGQLGDDPRGDGADVMDVELGLGQALDEVTHTRIVPPPGTATHILSLTPPFARRDVDPHGASRQ
ncbi:hypothetical protein GCM10009798_07630 [Nocardioides panacihumi]|uniref:Uncharacterized protein n=1 Tax=Nocardioides panacihumi TaxID=400774 RepID=A0ABN2QFJ8_9ACTN